MKVNGYKGILTIPILTTHYSLLTTHDSQFTIHDSPFTIHDSPFTTTYRVTFPAYLKGRVYKIDVLKCFVLNADR